MNLSTEIDRIQFTAFDFSVNWRFEVRQWPREYDCFFWLELVAKSKWQRFLKYSIHASSETDQL